MRARLLDPDDYKRNGAKDEALRRVMKRRPGYNRNSNADASSLRIELKPHYKSIERKEARGIQKGGKKAIKNIKGKIGYFKHLDNRARSRGEELHEKWYER